MDVLVIEAPLVRETAVAVLREAGFSVAEAASAEEALALAESADDAGGPPAVLVADLRLGPGMDGLALGTKTRAARSPDVGVVYATGHPDSFDGRLLGPRERYVLKPFTPAALLGAVACTSAHQAAQAAGRRSDEGARAGAHRAQTQRQMEAALFPVLSSSAPWTPTCS